MDYREFDNSIYKKCGILSAQEQLVTGYKRRADMNKSYIGLYLDPVYQQKAGSGEYSIKGTKDIFPRFRSSKNKRDKRDKDEEMSETNKRIADYKKALKKKSKYSEQYKFGQMRTDLSRARVQLDDLRRAVKDLWVQRAVGFVNENDAEEALVGFFDLANGAAELGISANEFERLSIDQQIRTLLALDGVDMRWIEKNLFFQTLGTGSTATPGTSLVDEAELAEMLAGVSDISGESLPDLSFDELMEMETASTEAEAGSIESVGITMDLPPPPRRDITETAPRPRRDITETVP
jgi:hypothetical protein